MQITTVGLDTAKSVFHVIGLNSQHTVVMKKSLRRAQVLKYFVQLPVTTVALEACSGSHYWGRELTALGHAVKLIPAQHVKAFLRGQKNDYNDALAIAEAASRPQLRCVPIKSLDQQDAQALHRLRQGLIGERTAHANRLRGLLTEYGLVLPQGLAVLRRRLPELLEDADNALSAFLRTLLAQARTHLLHLDAQIEALTQCLKSHLAQQPSAARLRTVPGFGPILASAWLAKIGDGHAYRRARDVSSALGIVPQQHSSGGHTQLLGISKRGDAYLRYLLIHAARAVLIHAHKKEDSLSRWITQIKARRGIPKATVALANKLARIAWAVGAHQTPYQPRLAA